MIILDYRMVHSATKFTFIFKDGTNCRGKLYNEEKPARLFNETYLAGFFKNN
jgi:hypothetical protein